MIEKVYHFLELFELLMTVPYLTDRMIFKDGTTINLFYNNVKHLNCRAQQAFS